MPWPVWSNSVKPYSCVYSIWFFVVTYDDDDDDDDVVVAVSSHTLFVLTRLVFLFAALIYRRDVYSTYIIYI